MSARRVAMVSIAAALVTGCAGESRTSDSTSWRTVVLEATGQEESYGVAISPDGTVVGRTSLSSDVESVAHPTVWRDGVRTMLPEVGRANTVTEQLTAALAIAPDGTVVGGVTDEGGWLRAAVWRAGRLSVVGGSDTVAFDVDPAGRVIVGAADVSYPHEDDAPGPSEEPAPYVWHGGVVRRIGPFPGAARVTAINGRGQVIGRYETTTPTPDGGREWHGFIWDRAGVRDLGTLGGPSSYPTDVNDAGQVVGVADTRARDTHDLPVAHAFLWEHGTMVDLGTLGGSKSFAAAIDERGDVVGSADTAETDEEGARISHPFLWSDGRMTDLGTLGGSGEAVDVNERGLVAGTSFTPPADGMHQYAVVWQDGKISRLPTPAGLRSWAIAINDRGQVLGGRASDDDLEAPVRSTVWSPG